MPIQLGGPYLLCPQQVLEFAGAVGTILDETDEAQVPERIAESLRGLLSDQLFSLSELLSLVTNQGFEYTLRRYLLYRDPRARFSIQAILWGAGQASAIHDHLSWCVAGVYQGEQQETFYDFRPTRQAKVLVPISRECKRRGDVTHFAATKTNIHQVENSGVETAVSIHVYGVDIQKVGSSVRRSYSLDSALS